MFKALKRAALILAVATVCYAWLGFLLVPSLGLVIAKQQLAQYSKLPASIQRIEFNPFTLQLDIWGVRLGEGDSSPAAIEHLSANLQLDSAWTNRLHLKQVAVTGANVTVAFDKKGQLNLLNLFNLPAPTAAESTPEKSIFPVLIDQVQLADSRVRFNDQRQTTPIDVSFEKINLDVQKFTTQASADNAELTLSLTANDGTELSWQGSLNLNPLSSNGMIKAANLPLKSWWGYVAQAVDLKLSKGKLQLSAQYDFALDKQLKLNIKQAQLSASNLALSDKQNQPMANVKQLNVSDINFNLAQQDIKIARVSLDSLEAWADLDKQMQVNWQKIVPNRSQETKPATPIKESKPWKLAIKQIALSNSSAHWKDASPSQTVEMDATKLDLKLNDFELSGSQPFTYEVASQINSYGKLSSQGKIQLQPLSVDAKVSTNNLDLSDAQAWLSPFVRVQLLSATLDSNLAIKLDNPEKLAVSVTGNAQLNNLHTKDSVNKRDLLRWKSVAVNDIDFVLDKHLKLGKVTLNQPYIRFIINENLTTNFGELLVKKAPSNSSTSTQKPLPIHIAGIQINDGSANFADYSLSQNFSTAIQSLSGSIGTIDNQTTDTAAINITGKVDRYAPVTIAGAITPFDPLRKLSIQTSFKNVELTTLTPYSGKFAGYRIRKGRLTLDLNYQIERGHLQAQNKVLLEQLQLGEKVESPDAIDLPIKLAIALLKDSNGKIDIDLPLRGNLEDPQFSVGPIVWQSVRNLITRAVKSPFNFVANLAGGSSDDLSQVKFQAGSTQLDDNAKKSLLVLAKGLQERPLLKLEIEGTSNSQLDALVIAQYRLDYSLRETYLQNLKERGKRLPEPNKELDFSNGERIDLLTSLLANNKINLDPQWSKLSREERINAMEQALINHWQKEPRYLRVLAQQRAASIKQFLSEEGKIDNERLYLIDVSDADSDDEQQIASLLHLGG